MHLFKQVHFDNSFPPTTEEAIADFEKRTCHRLPEEYKQFLLAVNGGHPNPCYIAIPKTNLFQSVKSLYGLHDSGEYNTVEKALKMTQEWLETIREDLEDELEEKDLERYTFRDDFVVIGHNPGLNRFILMTKGPHQGHVFFWDVQEVMPSSVENNRYWLANSFGEFLESLSD